MRNSSLSIVVLAAGLGTRMKSARAKVLHPLAGRPMILHILETLEQLAPERIVVVIGEEMEGVRDLAAPHPAVVQTERLGTAHAVMAAGEALAGLQGDVLIAYADTPLISAETFARVLAARQAPPHPGHRRPRLSSRRSRRLRPAGDQRGRRAGGDRRGQGRKPPSSSRSASATPE